MLIIPAIDLKDGRCVRLFQGEMDKETVYFERPVEAARYWLGQGVRFIHIVDLNGAIDGRPIHTKEVEEICKQPGLIVQLGGGIRTIAAAESAFALGVSRVVIGTAAHKNAPLLAELCKRFPGKIAVGIDARHGKAAVEGWIETTGIDAVELAKRCEDGGAASIIYTDIARDGTSAGINVSETLKVARAVRIPVIASGGVSNLDDIRALLPFEKDGIEGVIVGRALYAGKFSFGEAQAVVAA